jgi:single-stranded DNA-binding protein
MEGSNDPLAAFRPPEAPAHLSTSWGLCMSAFVLIHGHLFRQAEQRMSKAGKPYATATIRAKDGDGSQWWKVLTFSESAGAELLRLADGDAVSVQGALRVETYEREGVTKLSLTCIADQVLALRQPPRQREKKSAEPKPVDARSRQERCAGISDPALDDAVPF